MLESHLPWIFCTLSMGLVGPAHPTRNFLCDLPPSLPPAFPHYTVPFFLSFFLPMSILHSLTPISLPPLSSFLIAFCGFFFNFLLLCCWCCFALLCESGSYYVPLSGLSSLCRLDGRKFRDTSASDFSMLGLKARASCLALYFFFSFILLEKCCR